MHFYGKKYQCLLILNEQLRQKIDAYCYLYHQIYYPGVNQ